MKKTTRLISLLLVIIMLLPLFSACADEKVVVINITGADINTPMSEVSVEVRVQNRYVEARTQWMVWDNDQYVPAAGILEPGKDYLLHVYYNAGGSLNDHPFDITVSTGELDYSEMAGEDILTVIRFNYLARGNLSLVCGNTTPGMLIEDSYCAVTLDGMPLSCHFEWSVKEGDALNPVTDGARFEAGKYYELSLFFLAPEDYDRWSVPTRVNCGEGKLASIYPDGEEYMALVVFNYATDNILTIQADNVSAGVKLSDIQWTVTYDDLPLETQVSWSIMGDNMMIPLEEDYVLKPGEYHQAYLHFHLPEGIKGDELPTEALLPDYSTLAYVEQIEGTEYMALVSFDLQHLTEEEVSHIWIPDENHVETIDCENGGIVHYICTQCGGKKDEEVSGPGHDYLDYGNPEGYCDTGLIWTIHCSRCGNKSTRTEGSKDHSPDWQHLVDYEAPNCSKGGYATALCTVCGTACQVFYDPNGEHQWEETDVAGECTSGLTIWYCCRLCQEVMEEECSPLPDHTYGDAVYISNAYHLWTCERCGQERVEEHTLDSDGICTVCHTAIIN